MKKIITVSAALALTTTAATAGDLERSGQNITAIFEDGSYAEFSFGAINPSVLGTDKPPFGNSNTGNVAQDYNQVGFAYKMDINPKASFALIFDQPYGADVDYPTDGSDALGGTKAYLNSKTVTALARSRINNTYSVHGGLRAETINGNITLDGGAYGPLAGYNVQLDGDTAYGYSVGGAFERNDIALRIAVTYHSSIEHNFDTKENGTQSSTTTVNTPQAANLDFQSGVAADTIVFGSVRWADYSELKVSPAAFSSLTGGASLTNIEDSLSYKIGVGRKFSDAFSGSLSVGYQVAADSDLVSPLAPTNGSYSVALGGKYTVDSISFSGGVRYTILGDAQTSGSDRAAFSNNSAVAIGLKVGYNY